MLREYFSKTSKIKYTWKRETFKKLLIHLHKQKCYAILRNYHYVGVLHNMSSFGDKLVRDIETWENIFLQEQDQLSDLIKHCFALYNTPEFLENAFYSNDKTHMIWYVQLGSGKSVKELSQMPVFLTKKMAHEFRKAPDFLSVEQALRYAQALGFGASKEVAETISLSRMSTIRNDQEHFWATVVQFISREKELNIIDVDLMVDYLAFKYREDRSISMRNRTFSALLSQSNEWHRKVYFKRKGEVLAWNPSGIKPLYLEEIMDDRKVTYKTVELLNSVELYEEGLEMKHCVSEYDKDCNDGICSIFSLQQEIDGEPSKRLVTLEIGLSNYELVEAKAKYNEEPDRRISEMINTWINNSEVQKKRSATCEMPLQVQEGIQERRGINIPYDEIAVLVKLIFWALYFLFRYMVAAD